MGKELQKFELPKEYVKATENSLTFKEGTPYEVWEDVGVLLKRVGGAIQLWLGDWLNFGEYKYGEKYSQALDETHYEYTTLKEFASVAKRTESIRKKVATSLLLMGHWDIIADIDEDKQEEWIKKVVDKNLTIKELRQAYKDSKILPTPELPEGKYQVILADPPWMYGQEQHSKEKQDTVLETHYQSMPTEKICELPIKELGLDDSVLFLWTTSPKLYEAKEIIDAWGYEYKASMIWDKVKHNVGYYVSVRHEFLLICTRGSCLPDNPKLHDSVVTEERTEHPRKPEKFYEIIEDIYKGKKIELFARKPRKNWDSSGYSVKKIGYFTEAGQIPNSLDLQVYIL